MNLNPSFEAVQLFEGQAPRIFDPFWAWLLTGLLPLFTLRCCIKWGAWGLANHEWYTAFYESNLPLSFSLLINKNVWTKTHDVPTLRFCAMGQGMSAVFFEANTQNMVRQELRKSQGEPIISINWMVLPWALILRLSRTYRKLLCWMTEGMNPAKMLRWGESCSSWASEPQWDWNVWVFALASKPWWSWNS